MQLRTVSSITGIAACLGVMLQASAAMAGSTISAWDIQQSPGKERIRIHWNEPSSIQINEFPAARQVVVRIADASISQDDLAALNVSTSPVLESAKLQSVTGTDGKEAIQATLTFREWHKPAAVAGSKWLTISYDVPGSASKSAPAPSAAPAASGEVMTLSNADFEALQAGKAGSSAAPSTGAGQDAAATPAAEPFAQFYVPEDLTAEQKADQLGNTDVGMLNTLALFERTVNLDYKDADLQNVVRSIATKLKMNIIMMPGDVKGRVTVSLANVRLGDAFDSLLVANDLAYKVEKGGIVRIVPRSEVKARDKETVVQSIQINWVDAKDVIGIIKPFLSKDGVLQAHDTSNTIIIEDVPEKIPQVQDLIRRIDLPEKQVKMEARLVDMSERAFRGLGFQTTWTGQDTTTYNIIPEDGGDPSSPDLKTFPNYTANAGGVIDSAGGMKIGGRSDVGFFGQKFNVEATLTALEQHNEAVTLANPIIMGLNNTAASIEIKRLIPYQDATNTDQGSVATIKFKDVGVKIDITPRITNNGYVILDVNSEQKIDTGSPGAVPTIDERKATSTLIAKDEQTIIMGGLREFSAVNGETGVPWLMRVPVIGTFFKTSTDRQTKTELALFVTPHILKDPDPSVYEQALYDKIDYNWELPDFYFDEVRTRKAPNETIDPRAKVR